MTFALFLDHKRSEPKLTDIQNSQSKDFVSLSPERISTLLAFSPRLEEAYAFIDRACSDVHNDSEMFAFAHVFRSVLKSENLEASDSLADKAHRIYLLHTNRMANKTILKYQDEIVQSVLSKLKPNFQCDAVKEQLRDGFVQEIFSRVAHLHGCFPQIALAKALNIPSNQLPPMRSVKYTTIISDSNNPLSGCPLYNQCL
jgi:hypothetical protein